MITLEIDRYVEKLLEKWRISNEFRSIKKRARNRRRSSK